MSLCYFLTSSLVVPPRSRVTQTPWKQNGSSDARVQSGRVQESGEPNALAGQNKKICLGKCNPRAP